MTGVDPVGGGITRKLYRGHGHACKIRKNVERRRKEGEWESTEESGLRNIIKHAGECLKVIGSSSG